MRDVALFFIRVNLDDEGHVSELCLPHNGLRGRVGDTDLAELRWLRKLDVRNRARLFTTCENSQPEMVVASPLPPRLTTTGPRGAYGTPAKIIIILF